MKIKSTLVAVFLCMILLPVSAEYRFKVPENRSLVEINTDASITIHYSITFRNEGQVLKVVDVGLPDGRYGNLQADLDGVRMRDIRKSTALSHGVEIHLGKMAIQPGSIGTLHLTARVTDRVFHDGKNKRYASVVFTPTWYGAKHTNGATHLVCEFLFPEGVGLNDPRYHGRPYNSASSRNCRTVYTWDIPGASPLKRYTFRASFPARVMNRIAGASKRSEPLQRVLGAIFSAITGSIPSLFFGLFLVLAIPATVHGRRSGTTRSV